MAERRSVSDPPVSYGYQVRAAHRAFDRLLQYYIGPHGVKNGDWYLLRVLWEREGLTQRELSREVSIRESTTVTMLNQMQDNGLVVKKRDAHDRRVQKIYLTPKARKMKSTMLSYAGQINDIAAEGISKNELNTFLRVIHTMNCNLLAADDR